MDRFSSLVGIATALVQLWTIYIVGGLHGVVLTLSIIVIVLWYKHLSRKRNESQR